MRAQQAARRMGEDEGRSYFVGTGYVRGYLFEVAPERRTDAELDTYPCLIHEPQGPAVEVEVYRVLDVDLWAELDDFEGFEFGRAHNEYERRITEVVLTEPPRAYRAWVYHYAAEPPHGARWITSGSWNEFTGRHAATIRASMPPSVS
jgi:gamma-glutamylcyclotransferase (GGCT)/AIG2-like uncharacterized protein YtfP